jgi:PE-PPE domain
MRCAIGRVDGRGRRSESAPTGQRALPALGPVMVAAVLSGALMTAPTPTADVSIPVRLVDEEDPLNALMVGGTFQPTPTASWMESILNDYIDTATGREYTAVPVTTPETVPLDPSLQTGLADLQAAMGHQALIEPGQPYLIEGYSQGAIVVADEKNALAATEAAGQQIPNVTFTMFGDPNRPDGGLLERFDGLYVPGVELDANGAAPTDAGIQTIDISGQYDAAADFPQYPINVVADLNALLGLLYVHGDYGGLTESVRPGATFEPLPTGDYDYVSEYLLGSNQIVQQVDGDTTFYFIPTSDLPLLDPLVALGVPESWINVIQPALQVIVEAGYDRSIPLGDPTPAELIPSIDPATFLLEFSNGVVQGADNFLELFGAQLPDFANIETFFTSAESWSEQAIGAPYDQVVNAINDSFNPFTLFDELEGPIGQDIQNLLDVTGIQQDLIAPFFGDLVGAIESLKGLALPQ